MPSQIASISPDPSKLSPQAIIELGEAIPKTAPCFTTGGKLSNEGEITKLCEKQGPLDVTIPTEINDNQFFRAPNSGTIKIENQENDTFTRIMANIRDYLHLAHFSALLERYLERSRDDLLRPMLNSLASKLKPADIKNQLASIVEGWFDSSNFARIPAAPTEENRLQVIFDTITNSKPVLKPS